MVSKFIRFTLFNLQPLFVAQDKVDAIVERNGTTILHTVGQGLFEIRGTPEEAVAKLEGNIGENQ
jgi:hypothetical protein